MNKQRGFTLIEMVLVIAIAIVISSLGYKQYQNMQNTKRMEALRTPVLQAKSVVQTYYNSYCNDLVTSFVAKHLTNSGLPTSGLKFTYGTVSPVSADFTGIKLPYPTPSGLSSVWRGEVKSEKDAITLYLTLWVPYTETNALNDLQTELGATSYSDTYPNSTSKVSQGRLLIWSWPAAQEAATVGNVRMGFGTATNTAFAKANILSYHAMDAQGGPVQLDKMACALVPAWLQAANEYLDKKTNSR